MLQSAKMYECPTCGKTFSRRTYLQLHEKIHGDKCYKCGICDKTFRQPAGLWIHKKRQSCLKRNLPSNKQSSASYATGEFDEETGHDGKRHKCDICSKRFTQKHLLTYHKRTHTGENPFPCTICGKMFRGEATLKIHQRTHTGQKPYKCIFCAKAFAQLGPLRQHCRKAHQTGKIYECDICKQQFEKFREVLSHKNVHVELSKQARLSPFQSETPFKKVAGDQKHELQSIGSEACSNSSIESCFVSEVDEERKDIQVSVNSGKSVWAKKKKKKRKGIRGSDKCEGTAHQTSSETSTKDCMITSSTKHEIYFFSVEEELSASMVCKRTIADMDASLLDEQMLARPVKKDCQNPCVDEKKYKCNVCSQEFSCAGVLKYHTRIHTGENPHSCTVCSKTFRTPGALTVHLRTHNGQKPYKCVFCSHVFTQRGALLQHCRRIHFSDQIYECGVCKEKFEKHRDLSSHSQIHSRLAQQQIDDEEMEAKNLKPLKIEPVRLDFSPAISPLNISMTECYPEKSAESLVSAERPCNVSVGAHERQSIKRSSVHTENKGNSPMHHIEHERDDGGTYTEKHRQVLNSCQGGNDRHFTNSPFRAYKEVGSVDVSFLDEYLPGSSKQDTEECDLSNDSGISPDTSPLDAVFECDELESDLIYEVSMQPTVDECSKTVSGGNKIASSSRVSTPDVEDILSCCSKDLKQSIPVLSDFNVSDDEKLYL
jgi:uncharacterized Zn-finger protein